MVSTRIRCSCLLAVAVALVVPAAAAAAPTITEYSTGLTAGKTPNGITAGPGSTLWFTEYSNPGAAGWIGTGGGFISELFATGGSSGFPKDKNPMGIVHDGNGKLWVAEKDNIVAITPGPPPTTVAYSAGLRANAEPTAIVAGPDGNLWFTDSRAPGRIGRITPAGFITEFSAGLPADSEPTDLAVGPDGKLWFTDAVGRIGRLDPVAPSIAQLYTSQLSATSVPAGITAGPDGAMWFTESGDDLIGRITVDGAITEYAGLRPDAEPVNITVGGDGALWFTEDGGTDAIGRITTDGEVTEHVAGLTSSSQPAGITTAVDGTVWFTESAGAGRLGRITVPPLATTQPATSVSGSAATLNAILRPNGLATTYHFEYGSTSSYGTSTADVTVPAGGAAVTVQAPVGGLSAAVQHHARLVASNAAGTATGADSSFTTAAADPTTPTEEPIAAPVSEPRAELGRRVVAAAVRGTVTFRPPGAARMVRMDGDDEVPVGSRIDTRHGTVELVAAMPGGKLQRGRFHGAKFQVSQRKSDGMTGIELRGGSFRGCPARAGAAGRQTVAVAAGGKRRSKQVRSIWGSDHNGKFRTHGRDSVATVRGTRWRTTDRCDGTLTRVVRGKVAVRDLVRKRTAIVRAGGRYLARHAR